MLNTGATEMILASPGVRCTKRTLHHVPNDFSMINALVVTYRGLMSTESRKTNSAWKGPKGFLKKRSDELRLAMRGLGR